MKNTNNGTIEFVNVEEMVNFANNPKLVTMTTVKQALTAANVEFKPNEARTKYCEHMQASGMWTVAENSAPIETENSEENKPMETANLTPENANSESPSTNEPANVDTNLTNLPANESEKSANEPANESAPMSKSEALEFLKEYETHSNTYANAHKEANKTFDTILGVGATTEDKRALTVAGLVAASGILATNVDQYLAEKFAGKKIGKVVYTGIDTVLIARQIAESEHDRLARQIANFEFSFQPELNKLMVHLFNEVVSKFDGKMPMSNVTIAHNGTIHFVNPIAPPAKRANKTATTNEGETKKRASYKVKDGLSVLKTGKDWSIHLTTAGNVYCFACTKTGKENCMITGEFSDTVGKSFAQNANGAYQYVTSPESRISVVQFFPSSCFDFEETN